MRQYVWVECGLQRTRRGNWFDRCCVGQEEAQKRLEHVRDVFVKEYGSLPDVYARSPGELMVVL